MTDISVPDNCLICIKSLIMQKSDYRTMYYCDVCNYSITFDDFDIAHVYFIEYIYHNKKIYSIYQSNLKTNQTCFYKVFNTPPILKLNYRVGLINNIEEIIKNYQLL